MVHILIKQLINVKNVKMLANYVLEVQPHNVKVAILHIFIMLQIIYAIYFAPLNSIKDLGQTPINASAVFHVKLVWLIIHNVVVVIQENIFLIKNAKQSVQLDITQILT